MSRPSWDFDYRPIASPVDPGGPSDDLVLATTGLVDPSLVAARLGPLAADVRVEPVWDRHPLWWTRLRFGAPVDRATCERRLREAGVGVRYVASAAWGSQRLPPSLDLTACSPAAPRDWAARDPSAYDEPATPGRWFVGAAGLDVHRPACGTGAGTRLAVIDNDAGDVENLDLDKLIPVGVDQVSRGSSHGAQLVAWAVRTTRNGRWPVRAGVAPDASPRLYAIAKPDRDVLSLPLAIVRAVVDGADVVLCATNVDGQCSPMLDDALEIAARLGRSGRGTAVVLPCSRETSSPEGSVHPSLSLGLGEPAADPRVFCVAPSGRDGGWFLWRDRLGRLHPFANRGPAVRWLAPGDDVALPFGRLETLGHAESSGAAAMAAGVLLLVLGQNPTLGLAELEDVLTFSATDVAPEPALERGALANQHDLLPIGRDRDGHNAKHGYGLLSARRACLLVSDPVSCALASMGEDEAATAWLALRDEDGALGGLYSAEAGRWAARALLANTRQRHAACALARALRLMAIRPERLRDQLPGALVRQAGMQIRDLLCCDHAPSPAVARELADTFERTLAALLAPGFAREAEDGVCAVATALWPVVAPRPVDPDWPSREAVGATDRLGA